VLEVVGVCVAFLNVRTLCVLFTLAVIMFKS
jgi:hypothetical protein